MKKYIKRFLPLITFIAIITISIMYNTFPRLQLNGSKNIELSYLDEYKEPGVIVKNAKSKNMSKVKIESNIKKEVGTYHVDYKLKLGIRTLYVRRNVKIVDNISPIIKLKGKQITEISLNEEYIEPGYEAYDEYDGNLTGNVEINGKVDSTKYGEYVITYKVTDKSNNKVEVNRIVKVIDEEKPIIKCKSKYSTFEEKTANIIGCTSQDNIDGDITEKIKVEGYYDINQKGIYKINYISEDESKNIQELNHNIIIYSKYNKQKIIFNLTTEEQTKLNILKDQDLQIENEEINKIIKKVINEEEITIKPTKELNIESISEIIKILDQMNYPYQIIEK